MAKRNDVTITFIKNSRIIINVLSQYAKTFLYRSRPFLNEESFKVFMTFGGGNKDIKKT